MRGHWAGRSSKLFCAVSGCYLDCNRVFVLFNYIYFVNSGFFDSKNTYANFRVLAASFSSFLGALFSSFWLFRSFVLLPKFRAEKRCKKLL